MTLSLGGPGVACSALRIRRLAAGELDGEERARTEAHLGSCARCQATERETARERARLAADLPFEQLASGVADRLAGAGRARARRGVGIALAAGVALAVAAPWLLRLTADRTPRRADFRLKGPGGIELHVGTAGGGSRPLSRDEPVPRGAALRVVLSPGAHRFAAVALVDADGVAILHAGPVGSEILPGAFEWTGEGQGTLVALLDDGPVDARAFAERLRRGGVLAASPGGRAEVLLRALRREPP